MHIYGLDHLDDLPEFSIIHRGGGKKRLFDDIVKCKITMETLEKSAHLYDPMIKSFNPATGREFTTKERILSLINLEEILDNAHKGKFYSWDLKKCRIRMPQGGFRNCSIRANYMLKIPAESGTNIYIFLHEEKNTYPNEMVRLKIHSAFRDGIAMEGGQRTAYPILKIDKRILETDNTEQLYILPAYKKRLEQNR